MNKPRFDKSTKTIYVEDAHIKLKDLNNICLITIDPCVSNHETKQQIRFWGKCNVVSDNADDPYFSIEEYAPCAQFYDEWYKMSKKKKDKGLDWNSPVFWEKLKPQQTKYNLLEFFNMIPKEKICSITEFKPYINYGMFIYSQDKVKIR